MECRHARETISAGDRRVLRGRKLRAHLRGCEGCRDFEAAIRERRETLAALAPPLAAPAALAAAPWRDRRRLDRHRRTRRRGLAGGAVAKTAATLLAVAAIGGGAAATGVLDRGGDARAPDREPAAAAGAASLAGGPRIARQTSARRPSAAPHRAFARTAVEPNMGAADRSRANPGGSSHGRHEATRPTPRARTRAPTRRPRRAGPVRDRARTGAFERRAAAARRRRPGRPPPPPGRLSAGGRGDGARADGRVARCTARAHRGTPRRPLRRRARPSLRATPSATRPHRARPTSRT